MKYSLNYDIKNWQSYYYLSSVPLSNGNIAVATGSGQYFLQILNPEDNLKLVSTLETNFKNPISALAILEYGFLMAFSADGVINIYDVNYNYKLVNSFISTHKSSIKSIFNFNVGFNLILSSDNAEIILWKADCFYQNITQVFSMITETNFITIEKIKYRNNEENYFVISFETKMQVYKIEVKNEIKVIIIKEINLTNPVLSITNLTKNLYATSMLNTIQIWSSKFSDILQSISLSNKSRKLIPISSDSFASVSNNILEIYSSADNLFNEYKLVNIIYTNHTAEITSIY